jgi:hypothetical protein
MAEIDAQGCTAMNEQQARPRGNEAGDRTLPGADARLQLGDESPLVDRPGAARYLKMCTRSVDNYARRGVLPYLKFGSRVLFRKVDLDALIEANVRRAGVETMEADEAEETEAP